MRRKWLLNISLLVLAGMLLPFFYGQIRSAKPQKKAIDPEVLVHETAKLEIAELSEQSPSDLGAADWDVDLIQRLRQLNQIGQYEQAIDLARSHLASGVHPPSFINWLEAQIPILLTSLAWKKYQQNQYHSALHLFEEALLHSEIPQAIRGLAGTYFQLRLLWQAEYYSRQYLELAPHDLDIGFLLLEILESHQNLTEAHEVIAKLQTAPDLNPQQEELLQQKRRTIKARGKESNHQHTISSSHFQITYRPDEHEALIDWLLDELEYTLDELRVDWGFEATSSIEIILYPEQAFSEVVHGPAWAQAVFDGRIRIPIRSAAIDNPAAVLSHVVRHELVHALTAQKSGNRGVPPWYSEGIAQYLECAGGCRLNFQISGGDFLARSYFERSFLSLAHEKARRAYIQSHFMIQTLIAWQGPQSLRNSFENLSRQGTINSDTILQSLGISFEELYEKSRIAWQKQK